MLGKIFRDLYVKVPDRLMVRFLKKEPLKILKFLSKNGHYKNRIYISESVSQMSIEAQIELLDILIEDPIPVVSLHAIESGKLVLRSKIIRQKAIEKEAYWATRKAELSEKQKRIAEILKGSTNYKRKFGQGESLKNVKQMLKKNLHGGKWF